MYYETLSPDSKDFIKNQLIPVHRKIPNLIRVELIPYGKAVTSTEPDGKIWFDKISKYSDMSLWRINKNNIEAPWVTAIFYCVNFLTMITSEYFKTTMLITENKVFVTF